MFRKRYVIAVVMDNPKDATLVAGLEGYGQVNADMNSYYPITMVIQKPRTYLAAVLKSMRYSRLGIFNCIMRNGD